MNTTQNKYTPVNGQTSIVGNTRMYTGREYDREILFFYNRARYYDANLGRFISRDPIGIQDNINLYTYTGNNPVMYGDPSGLKSKEAFVKAHDATKLLEDYMKDAREELSFWGYLPKFGYSYFDYANKSMGRNKWNIKYNTDFQNLSYNPDKNNESCSGYGNKGAGGCKVYINGESIELSEIGNFLIGYNGAYAGFTLNSKNMSDTIESNKLTIPYYGGKSEKKYLSTITTDIYEAGMRVEFSNYYSKNKTYEVILQDALNDELEDRPWYDNGYKTGMNEIRGNWGF